MRVTSVEAEIRQLIARLDLVSHVSAVALDSSGGSDASDDIGGKRPPGGINRKDDRELDWHLKSADHFRRRLAKAHGEKALQAIFEDARLALAAWKRQPMPRGEPLLDDPLWKSWVAASPLSDEDIGRKYSVSRRYVNRVRSRYSTA